MSAKQFLTDASTRHQVFLQRFGGSESKKAIKTLNRLSRDINARLANEPTIFQRQRLETVLLDIELLSNAAFSTISTDTMAGAKDLARLESEFSIELFNKVATVSFVLVSDDQLINSLLNSQMKVNVNSAVSIEEALRQFGTKKTNQIGQVIADGVTLGDTTPVISRKVGEIVNTLQRKHLDTLVRTVTNHSSSIAKQQIFVNNSDIIDGYRWIATLDGRTTFICASRDNKIFQPPHSPMPPAHWNCRSTTIPNIRPEFDLGAKLTGTRASIKGQVSAKLSYGGWLKSQPTEFIDEALGIERSRMFRSGRLTIDKFVDPTGRVYTLEQLRSMNNIALLEI